MAKPTLTPAQDSDVKHLTMVFARSMPGWNEDTEDGALTAHWEKVNRACIKQGRSLARLAVAAGYSRHPTAHDQQDEPTGSSTQDLGRQE